SDRLLDAKRDRRAASLHTVAGGAGRVRDAGVGSSHSASRENPLLYDVIIAGADPVDLFLACELRLGKLSVLVLEQIEEPHSPLKQLPFGMRGLWGPSVEAFYRRGLLEPIAAQPRAADRGAGQPRPGSMAAGSLPRGPANHFTGIQFDYANIDPSRWTYRLPG